ncbi:MAG: FAD binding domain-containing protein [Anaerolineae bacterium]|jgi:carbon-monoxide dehydrogenase medium subunit
MIEYVHPASVEEAILCLAAHDGAARVIAGGTDVLPDLRKGRITPSCLVDVTRIPSLNTIEVSDDFVRIGAAVTFAAIREHPFLRQHVHALVDAAASVGAGAIQNTATWVGNIVQAMPAADGSIVAIALDAEARIAGRDGAHWRPVEALFEAPRASVVDPTRQLITHVRFPHPGANTGTAWRRVGRRSALVLPILNCAVRLRIDADGSDVRLAEASIALGPVAPRPFRAREAEALIRGRVLAEDTLIRAARIAQREACPRSSVMRASREYRLAIIPTLVGEALVQAARRAAPQRVCSKRASVTEAK